MAENYQELLEELKSEETTETTTTPAEQTEQPAEQQTEQTTQPEQTAQTEQTEQPAEQPPEEQTEQTQQPEKKKPSEFTPQERADHAFKRQLAKQKEKYEKELKERDDKFAEMQKQLDELKKQTAPKTPKKKREEFKDDEDYLEYLADERAAAKLKELMAERDQKDAETAKQRAEEEERTRAEEAQVAEQRQLFIQNAESAFSGDENRKKEFFSNVAYAHEHGLGEVLDRAPVAADFLMYNPKGPAVFEKMLNDRSTFDQIFTEYNARNPMAMFMTLNGIADSLKSAPSTTQTAPVTPKPAVHIGKPGKQTAGVQAPDIFSDDDAMLAYLRNR